MKLQCTVDEHKKEGYFLADPVTNPDFTGDYYKLIDGYEDGELTEIYAPQLIDYIQWKAIVGLLELCSQKVRKNGIVVFGGTEPFVLSKALVNRELSPVQYNQLLFNKKGKISNLIPASDLRKTLTDLQFEIVDLSLDFVTYNYTVKAKRL